MARRLALAGAWAQILTPIVYVAGLFGMSRAIGDMDLANAQDQLAVIAQLGTVTTALAVVSDRIAIGMSVAMASLIPFIFALTWYQYRTRWAFWFSCIYGICLLMLSYLTLPFGIFLLVYAFLKRDEFPGRNTKKVVLESV